MWRRGSTPAVSLEGAATREGSLVSIVLNGEATEVPDGLTLLGLVEWLELPADRIAVERNLEIVRRRDWETTVVSAGDRLEVVQFVGGG